MCEGLRQARFYQQSPIFFGWQIGVRKYLPRLSGNLFRKLFKRKGIISALKNRDYEGAKENVQVYIDRPVAKAITLAMEQAGIRQSLRSRRVGDYASKYVT